MDLFKKYPALSLGVFALFTLIFSYYLGSRTGKGKRSDSSQIDKEIKDKALSYEFSQYASFADRIEDSLYGFTDDEEAVYNVISKLRTRSDVLQLIKVFGTRRIIFSFGESNLNRWFSNRLSSSEIAHINEILVRNNIDYQF